MADSTDVYIVKYQWRLPLAIEAYNLGEAVDEYFKRNNLEFTPMNPVTNVTVDGVNYTVKKTVADVVITYDYDWEFAK